MEKTELHMLMLAITGLEASITGLDTKLTGQITGLRAELKADIAGLRAEMTQGFARVDRELVEVRKDLKVIREQTALNSEENTALAGRPVNPS